MSPKNKKHYYVSAFIYLFRFIKPHVKWYTGASIIALILVGTGILHVKITQILIDSSIQSDGVMIIRSLIMFIFLISLNVALNYISGKCTANLSAKASMDMKRHIGSVLLNAEYGSILELKSGDVLSAINSDTQIVSEFIAKDLVGLFAQFALAIGAVIYILFLNPLLAIIAFAFTPIGMVFTMNINRKMNELYPANADFQGEALSIFEQALMQIPVIKSFMAEKHILKKMNNVFRKLFLNQKKISVWDALMQPACSMTAQLPKILYIIYAGTMVMNGNLTLGMFIAVFDLLLYIIGPSVYFPFMLNNLNRSVASINRIKRLEAIPQSIKTYKYGSADVPKININNMTFAYKEEKTIFNNFSFYYKGAGVIALCGESGSGKTTLFDLIAGLYNPNDGEVSVSGLVSVVTQEPFFFRASVFENIQIANNQATEKEVYNAIKLAGAESFIKMLPEGFKTLLGDGNTNLSGGQRQRLSLARAILSDFSILLLDEPTSALDHESEQIIVNAIKEISKTKLVIIAAHRDSLKSFADVVINLDLDNSIEGGAKNEI